MTIVRGLLRKAASACVLIVGLAWLIHATLKLNGGISEGTLYGDWTLSRPWLHYLWCGVELSLGAGLLAGRKVRETLLVSMFLLAMLSTVILAEPSPKPCGCGAQRKADRDSALASTRWSLGRNAALLALSFTAIAFLPPPRKPEVPQRQDASPAFG